MSHTVYTGPLVRGIQQYKYINKCKEKYTQYNYTIRFKKTKQIGARFND